MKHAVEMGSGAMMYVYTEFNKDWFRISKVDMGDALTGSIVIT
jgi:hypothetical protein